MSDVKPFRVIMRLKNNRMVTFRGDRSAKEMGEIYKLPKGVWGRYEGIKVSPIKLDRLSQKRCYVCAGGIHPQHVVCKEHQEFKAEAESHLPAQWTKTALRISDACGKDPEWLWPECIIAVKKSEEISLQMSEIQVKQLAPDEQLFLHQRSEKITDVLETLPEREQLILEMTYGLNGKPCLSTVEIAKRLEVSKSRISQIIDRSLRLLRHPSRSRMLREVLPTHVEDRFVRDEKRKVEREKQEQVNAKKAYEMNQFIKSERLAKYEKERAEKDAFLAQIAERKPTPDGFSKLQVAIALQRLYQEKYPGQRVPDLQDIYESMED